MLASKWKESCDTNLISWCHVHVCLELPLSMIAFDEMFMTAVYVILFAGYSLVEEQYLIMDKSFLHEKMFLSSSTWIVIFGTALHHSFLF